MQAGGGGGVFCQGFYCIFNELFAGLYESPTIQNLEAQASIETGTTAALESRDDSMEMESELKTSTTVLLRFDGLSAILFVEKETEEVSTKCGEEVRWQ